MFSSKHMTRLEARALCLQIGGGCPLPPPPSSPCFFLNVTAFFKAEESVSSPCKHCVRKRGGMGERHKPQKAVSLERSPWSRKSGHLGYPCHIAWSSKSSCSSSSLLLVIITIIINIQHRYQRRYFYCFDCCQLVLIEGDAEGHLRAVIAYCR